MIVELTGITGTGKSTVLEELTEFFRLKEIDVLDGYDRFLSRFGFRFRNKILRTAAVELLLVPAMAISALRKIRYTVFCFRKIAVSSNPVGLKIAILRNTLKQQALLSVLQLFDSTDKLTILDEGTLHNAHNLFIGTPQNAESREIKKFVQLVDLPPVAVVISAPDDLIVMRSMTRNDPPRKNMSKQDWINLISKGKAVYTALLENEEIRKRVIQYENIGDSGIEEPGKAILNIIKQQQN